MPACVIRWGRRARQHACSVACYRLAQPRLECLVLGPREPNIGRAESLAIGDNPIPEITRAGPFTLELVSIRDYDECQ